MTKRPESEQLLVLCSESELQEYGESVRVGEEVRRQAGRREGAFYGDELDDIEWRFDQHARVAGYESATISGRVVASHAVFVDLEAHPDGWRPALGSAHLEQVDSTSSTRVIEEEVARGTPSEPDDDGCSIAIGHPVIHEGDERLSGWLFTLENAAITPLPSDGSRDHPERTPDEPDRSL